MTDTQPRIDRKALEAIAALVGAWEHSDNSDAIAALSAIKGVLKIAGQQPFTDVQRVALAQVLLSGCAPVDEGTLGDELDLVEATERCGKLEDALRLILPMARGYAAEHPVGDNQGKVEHAAAAINACDHEWIDIRNSIVQNGSMCRHCNAVRAENA